MENVPREGPSSAPSRGVRQSPNRGSLPPGIGGLRPDRGYFQSLDAPKFGDELDRSRRHHSGTHLHALLSRAKRKVGRTLNSTAMMTDAKQTDFCMYQAAIVLFGLLVHTAFGIGWADSAAALLLVPLLLRAGTLSLRGQSCCTHHSHVH